MLSSVAGRVGACWLWGPVSLTPLPPQSLELLELPMTTQLFHLPGGPCVSLGNLKTLCVFSVLPSHTMPDVL